VLSLDIRSLRQRTGGTARQLPLYHVILCCVEVDYTIDEQRRVAITDARRALPEDAWAAQQDAAAAAVPLSDGEEGDEEGGADAAAAALADATLV
jgi:hypothetical protein